MALDAILINKITDSLQDILPCRINKIYQISKTEILFHLKTSQGKKQLIISCHSIYNRINLTNRSYPTPEEPGNFIMVLRKYLEGASILRIEQVSLDRAIMMDVSFRNDIGDRLNWKLSVELMGKYANVILINDQDRIVDALKRIPPFENNVRTIHPGAVFKPIQRQDRKDPFIEKSYDPSIPLTKQFLGFSPLLEKEVKDRIDNGESFADIMQKIKQSNKLYVASSNNEALFHCIELKHLKNNKSYDINEGFDIVYYHLEEKDRIKQLSGDLFKFVKKQIKHSSNKLIKLNEALDEALNCEILKTYGDLLYTYNINDTKGQNSIELENYEDGKMIKIPLDPKLDGKANANKWYNKYRKQKKAKSYIEEQIAIATKELVYFEAINEQLTIADFNDAKEIKDELVDLGYLKKQKVKIRRNKKPNIPSFNTIILEDGTKIMFGKNNIQNDYLTFKLANKNDLWFHAKDYHGSHVIVQTTNANEQIIRLAANIAAYYSAGRMSSSVPVNYCLVKNLKKIPQSKIGLVSLSSYKTIYIDPDLDIISKYKRD